MQALNAFPDYHFLSGMKLHWPLAKRTFHAHNGIDCLNSLAHQVDQKSQSIAK
jgi:hypothetical protein